MLTAILFVVLFSVTFVPMLLEARRAAANEAQLRATGAVEPAGDVYRIMQVAYPAAFLAMIAEGAWRGVQPGPVFAAGAIVFAAAKALKYWAIATLGPRWTFRVLVPPQSSLVVAGPYRYLRHPNYVGVAGELIGMALMSGAAIAGAVGTVAFMTLVAIRIRIEERALAGVESRPQ